MNQWQPIESAPRDGTTVALINMDSGIVDTGYWHDWKGQSLIGIAGEWNQEYGNGEMTHWMPLPEAPKEPTT